MAKGDHKYFYEDEVWRVHKGTLKLGMVVETSEFTSEDESSDEDDKVKHGDVRVAWYPAGTEQVIPEKRLHLADRSLMPGDIVRRMGDRNQTQRGFCKYVNVSASVEVIGTKQVVFGIKSEDLTPLEKFKSEILICKDGWVGIVRNVKAKLTLRFSDSSKVIVDDEVAADLEDVFNRKEHDTEFIRYDFYPGQILFGPIRVVDSSQWIDCSTDLKNARKKKPHKVYKMTVEDVDFQKLFVSWLCKANFGSSDANSSEEPGQQVSGEELTQVRMLNVFEPCTLQIGDRNFYSIKDKDLIMSKSEWRKLQLDQLGRTKSNKVEAVHTEMVKQTTHPPEEDLDDNSSDYEDCEDDKDSNSSDRPSVTGAKKKKKNALPTVRMNILSTSTKKKLRKSKPTQDRVGLIPLVQTGMLVVTETLSTKSEIDVVWQDGRVEKSIPSTDLYPIQHLDDHDFFPGDFVVESKDSFHPHTYGVVQDVDYVGRYCHVKWFRTYMEGKDPEPIFLQTSESSVYDLKDHPDFKYRPGAIVIRVANWNNEECGLGAGQVMDMSPSGKVKIWWASAQCQFGITSYCWPQDLYKVGEYDSDEDDLWAEEDEDNDSDCSWSTQSEHEVFGDNDEVSEIEKYKIEKIVSLLEKAGVSINRLTKLLRDNPTMQSSKLMKELTKVCFDCKNLDKLMDTQFFQDTNFHGLLEKVKDKEKISKVERAVQSQVSRLFSVTNDSSLNRHEIPSLSSDQTNKGEDDLLLEESLTNKAKSPELTEHDQQICAKLCRLLLEQLVAAHDEVVKRYGEHELLKVNYKDDTDTDEMKDSIADELTVLGFIPFDTPIFQGLGDWPTSPDEKPEVSLECVVPLSFGSFQTVEFVPDYHKFKLTVFQPSNMKTFMKSVKREIALLQTSLPHGITVKGFDERMDLFSAMIEGPKNTPYEDGLFFFDFQLGSSYPSVPPTCHYVSFCSDKLNPNLYEDGKVCVSLLGTWTGKGTETWTPNSNLLQLLVSIQGLILVREPYFNEAGYERQRGTSEGSENSRNYNEMAVLKLVQSMSRLLSNPPQLFVSEIRDYCIAHSPRLIRRLEKWLSLSTTPSTSASVATESALPDFPLLPASRGFCLSLEKALETYKLTLKSSSLI